MGCEDSTVRDAFYWDARTDAIRELELNTRTSNSHCTVILIRELHYKEMK
jgi:hypothetical protein